jgi:hypothetical protein
MNHGLLLGYKIAMFYTLTEAIFLKFWHEGIIFLVETKLREY